jgi:hypothetical protein
MMTRGLQKSALAVVIGTVAVFSALANVAAASTPWSGNAAAIAYYRKAVANTNALKVIQDVSHGYYWLWDSGYSSGTSGEFQLNWGFPTKPAADMISAQATVTLRMLHGKTSWYTVIFAAPCAKSTSCSATIDPLEFYVTKGGVVWGYLTKGTDTVACWNHTNATSAWIPKDFTAGTVWWKTSGDYRPIHRGKTAVLITSTYKYSDGAAVTETDSINPTTRLFTGSTYLVGKSTHPVDEPYHYSVVETDPTSIPHAPSIKICG